ncbi:MAG TPA: HNH endonuclease [Stenomitos sp.]
MSKHIPNKGLRAWLLLVYGEEQTYGGHSGYNDIIQEVYRYDNFVPNHKNISEGDLVILRDQKGLLGLARIVSIEMNNGFKQRNRCPVCNTTNLDQRTTKSPIFRCAKGHEFDRPIEKEEPCVNYSAYFGNTYTNAEGVLSRHQLSQACPRYNQQLAMQLIEVDKIKQTLIRNVPDIESLFDDSPPHFHMSSLEADEDDINLKTINIAKTVVRQIKERRGQQKFRQALIQFYDSRCVITDCDIVDILEAAHISPYSVDYSNSVTNGLLLRSDIHTLFDLNLLGINPNSLTVYLHPDIQKGEYKKYKGVSLPIKAKSIDRHALVMRWKSFQSRLS